MNLKVAIAISGGVDSSVSAYLLKQEGYELIALFMKNWGDDPECPLEEDYQDALTVCEKLSIPIYTLNFTKEYEDLVFKEFIRDLEAGFTPNPDILCNRKIKFSVLLNKALELGCDFLATGHYARLSEDGSLFKAHDLNKDQSYFLAKVHKESFKKVLFPLAKITKPQVRQIAKEQGLINHNKKDSTGICFIGERNFSNFINQYIKNTKGAVKNIYNEVIAEHSGIWHHTIGQRKGLGIGGPGDAYFVYKKCIATNTVWVCQGKEHKALFSNSLYTDQVHWLATLPIENELLMAKIRYRGEDQECKVTLNNDGSSKIVFTNAQRAIAPGQLVVLYRGNQVVGSATILRSGKTLFEMDQHLDPC
jgi:tRNA-uridine 2-sulfurtransferase